MSKNHNDLLPIGASVLVLAFPLPQPRTGQVIGYGFTTTIHSASDGELTTRAYYLVRLDKGFESADELRTHVAVLVVHPDNCTEAKQGV